MASNLAIDSTREEENKACIWANAQTVASDRRDLLRQNKTKPQHSSERLKKQAGGVLKKK